MRDDIPGNKNTIEKEFRGKGLLGYWYYTLKFSRTQRRVIPDVLSSIKTRICAVSGLPDPIFILGSPRSGTTYLGELLEELPEVSYYFEPPLLKYLAKKLYHAPKPKLHIKILYKLIFRTLLFFSPGTGRQIVEKNPNNTFVFNQLTHIFPKSKFIVIKRDGLDVAASLLKKPWHLKSSENSGKREPGGYLYGPYPHFYIEKERTEEYQLTTDAHRCIWVWKRHNDAINNFVRSMQKDRYFQLSYEDLVRDPAQVIPRMAKFLGIKRVESVEAVLESSKRGKVESIGNGKSYLSDVDLTQIEKEVSALSTA